MGCKLKIRVSTVLHTKHGFEPENHLWEAHYQQHVELLSFDNHMILFYFYFYLIYQCGKSVKHELKWLTEIRKNMVQNINPSVVVPTNIHSCDLIIHLITKTRKKLLYDSLCVWI